jgi:CheY-like chemotaxis protein
MRCSTPTRSSAPKAQKRQHGSYARSGTSGRAADGEEALAEVQKEEPDVMLLDLHMPRMNGVELCMQLRGDGLAQSCSIISVSAGAQEHDVQLLHQLGIHHFVEKGSNLRERLRTVFVEVCGDQALANR